MGCDAMGVSIGEGQILSPSGARPSTPRLRSGRRRAMDLARGRVFPHALAAWAVIAHLGLVASAAFFNGGGAALGRSSFPPGFIFGSSTAAYQVEGAVREGSRGPSMWDAYTHRHPENIDDGSNGDVAIDFYHRYKQDLKMMKEMGLDAYRFSFSWTRMLPHGRGEPNKEGIAFYRRLIREILSKGLRPFVTIFHWDTPLVLEDEYGGFLSGSIVEDFRNYADLCFREFGDLVKHWITLNEPWTFCSSGYATGHHAPGRCSPWEGNKCSTGDSGTEPYAVGHNMLLAHAAAAKLYREKYQASQKGVIGVTLNTKWVVPLSEQSESDMQAAGRALDFMFGWFMDPLAYGEYPRSMRTLVGGRLPEFTEEQAQLLRGSFDFLGVNYYSGYYAREAEPSARPSYTTDSRVHLTGERNGVPIGIKAPREGFYIYPQGIKNLLLHTKNKYNVSAVFVTENGIATYRNSSSSLEESLNDTLRVYYYHRHLEKVLEAIREGVDVRGYFAWSLFDDFEWNFGYTIEYGIVYVDFKDGLKRYKKKSAVWFQKLLRGEEEADVSASM